LGANFIIFQLPQLLNKSFRDSQ